MSSKFSALMAPCLQNGSLLLRRKKNAQLEANIRLSRKEFRRSGTFFFFFIEREGKIETGRI